MTHPTKVFLPGKQISNFMVKLSHYKAANFMKSNLIFVAASLSIKFVKSESKSKVLEQNKVGALQSGS